MTLDQMKSGESGIIEAVRCEQLLRRRLLDMGLTPKTRIMGRKVAPLGDPMEVCLRGYELTLRKDDARNIEVREVPPCPLK
ncbi:MAG: FeoA family protein [Bacillota bacterium]|nr:FeoA family protein [Bacillota bacterium]